MTESVKYNTAWCVYLLRQADPCDDASRGQGSRLLYVGMTNHVRGRLMEHNAGKCKATRGRLWELVAVAVCKDRRDAATVEKWLKVGNTKGKRQAFSVAFDVEKPADVYLQTSILNAARVWKLQQEVRTILTQTPVNEPELEIIKYES